MASDPYHAVQAEIQETLASAGTLLASFRRIHGMGASGSASGRTQGRGKTEESEELAYARSELKATLSTLEADLDDLEESVRIVESTGARHFNLSDSEVQSRKRYVRDVRLELENMRAEVAQTEDPSGSGRYTTKTSNGTKPNRDSRTITSDPLNALERGEDEQAAWGRMEQQMIMQEQDKTIDSISGTMQTLTEQAGLMGQEINEHNELLDDLGQHVDKTDTKLSEQLKRIKRFIRQTEETKSGWCILILIIILLILLLLVILL